MNLSPSDSRIDFLGLTRNTDAFLKTMYAVRDHFSLTPEKARVATCITYADLQEMRDAFLRELTNTAITFVYSPERQQQIVSMLQKEGRDIAGAYSELLNRARKKFRKSNLQGQFSELLLSNLLQHYYRAAPLLRKMPITTNPETERNGADAIHVAREGDGYRLYLGEAKTYNRKQHSLKERRECVQEQSVSAIGRRLNRSCAGGSSESPNSGIGAGGSRCGQEILRAKGEGLGSYFLDGLFSEIDSLLLYAGIHGKVFGYHRLLVKRFPYAIYYKLEHESLVVVWRVLDLRRSPSTIRAALR